MRKGEIGVLQEHRRARRRPVLDRDPTRLGEDDLGAARHGRDIDLHIAVVGQVGAEDRADEGMAQRKDRDGRSDDGGRKAGRTALPANLERSLCHLDDTQQRRR